MSPFQFDGDPLSQLVLVFLPSLDSSQYRKNSCGFKFKTLFPCLTSPLPRPPRPPLHPTFSCTSGHQLQLFSGHSPCPWDTPFIYFLLNFSALRGSFPAVPGGTGSMLGVSQRLAGVGRDARGAVAAEVVLERYAKRWSGRGLSGHLIHTG